MRAKLRFKFVVITFLCIMLITTIILGIAVLENYMIVDNQINQMIRIIETNKLEADIDDYFSEDAIYGTRYFTVTINNENQLVNFDLSKISSVDKSKSEKLAVQAFKADSEYGYLENFKFKRSEMNNATRFLFLDCSLQLKNLKSFAEATFAVYLISLLILFGILVSISDKVIAPLFDNIEQQKQFVTNAGHELKTPLAIINANIDVLEFDLGEDNEWLLSIRNQITRLDMLVKSLLSLSKHDLPQVDITQNICEFNMKDLLEEEIANFKSMSTNKQIILNSRPDILIKSDITHFRQLIGLFLDNAIKYTVENGNIIVTVQKSKNTLQLCFENTCHNIDKINTKKIFERFYRGDKSHNKKIEGYGIGLSIANSIVEKYNGKIIAKKKENVIEFILQFKNNKKYNFELI